MDSQEFIEKFATIFDDVDVSALTMDTIFRDIDEWSSLSALSLLAMVEEEYGVNLNNQDIRDSASIADIFEIVKTKKS